MEEDGVVVGWSLGCVVGLVVGAVSGPVWFSLVSGLGVLLGLEANP